MNYRVPIVYDCYGKYPEMYPVESGIKCSGNYPVAEFIAFGEISISIFIMNCMITSWVGH